MFTNVINPRSAVVRKHEYQSTHVGKGATIGANATIVCGNNTVSLLSLVQALLLQKIFCLMRWLLAILSKQIGWMSDNGHRLHFDENGFATCKESGEKYQL